MVLGTIYAGGAPADDNPVIFRSQDYGKSWSSNVPPNDMLDKIKELWGGEDRRDVYVVGGYCKNESCGDIHRILFHCRDNVHIYFTHFSSWRMANDDVLDRCPVKPPVKFLWEERSLPATVCRDCCPEPLNDLGFAMDKLCLEAVDKRISQLFQERSCVSEAASDVREGILSRWVQWRDLMDANEGAAVLRHYLGKLVSVSDRESSENRRVYAGRYTVDAMAKATVMGLCLAVCDDASGWQPFYKFPGGLSTTVTEAQIHAHACGVDAVDNDPSWLEEADWQSDIVLLSGVLEELFRPIRGAQPLTRSFPRSVPVPLTIRFRQALRQGLGALCEYMATVRAEHEQWKREEEAKVAADIGAVYAEESTS